MIITIKGADFSAKNIGTLSTWTILTTLGEGASYSGNRLVDKDSSLSATITIADGYELGSAGVSVIMGTTDVTSSAATVSGNTITISIATVTGNVIINVPTLITGEEEPNYTFTINPTPVNATVTLTASGYTQSGNNITVPNGTTVSWSVSVVGYTEQIGTWIANGSDETNNVKLVATGDSDITSYIVDGKGINDVVRGLETLSGFFTVHNYPVIEGHKYSIPYARNGYYSNDSGVTVSTSLFKGGGSDTFTTTSITGATKISLCFRHSDIAPADVVITDLGEFVTNPDVGVTTTSYGGIVKTNRMVTFEGILNSNSGTNAIDKIPVNPSTKYQLVAGCRNTALLNNEETVIETISGTNLANAGNTFTTTADTAYIRTCYYWNDPDYPKLSVAKFTLTEV